MGPLNDAPDDGDQRSIAQAPRPGSRLPRDGDEQLVRSDHSIGSNRILRALPPEELAWLQFQLEIVPLESGKVLVEPNTPITHVYFPDTAVVSQVNRMQDGNVVEVGTIGREGMVGISVFLDADALPSQTLVQVPGNGRRMDVTAFKEGAASRPALQRVLRRYTHAYMTQIAQTAACNRMHNVEQRCARWLLMTHDRVRGPGDEGDRFSLTHEFLSFMLGVRRAGVTVAAGALQEAALIRYRRGKVSILDRPGLERASCECYGIVRDHFDRLLGAPA